MKNINLKFIWIVLFALLSAVSLLACGSGSSGGGASVNSEVLDVAEYAGHYEGTIFWTLDDYDKDPESVEFDIDTDGNIVSLIVDGISYEINDIHAKWTADIAINVNGEFSGQGGYVEVGDYSVNFTFDGIFNLDSGEFDIHYTFSGDMSGTADIIGLRTD